MATARNGYNCKFINNALQHLAIDGVEVTEVKRSEGALGTVVEGRWVGAPCAIKRLRTEHTTEYLSDRFLYECTLWSELKHPNVLQFYGLYFPLKDGYPVIVTELLQHNLNQYLTAQPRPAVPLTTKACILRDVALAVRYLHSLKPPIIIRELSASFVYLTPGLMAKLGEFGTATKLCNDDKEDLDDCASEPEASLPVVGSCSWPEPYSSFASDAFSFGDLILHVLLHAFPVPDDKIRIASTGTERYNVLTELARREKFLSQLTTPEKILLPVLAHCYEDVPKARPSFVHLCTSLDIIIAHLNDNGLEFIEDASIVSKFDHMQLRPESVEVLRDDLAQSQSHQSDVSTSPVSEQVEFQVHPRALSASLRACRQATDTGNQHHQTMIDGLLTSRHSSRPQQFSSVTGHTSPCTATYENYTPQNERRMVRFHSTTSSELDISPLSETTTSSTPHSYPKRASHCGTLKMDSWISTSTSTQEATDSRPSSPISFQSTSSGSSSGVVSHLDTRKSQSDLYAYALLRKNYKSLKRGETVVIPPGAWNTVADSCTVHSERTSVCESIHPASKHLEVLRPIKDEPWFTKMSKEDVEAHMQKEYIVTGNFLILRGECKSYVLAVKYSGKVHFFQIFHNPDQTFSLNKEGMPSFVTISELVKEHTQQKMGLATLLTVPYIRKRMELPRESFSMDEEIHQGKHFVVWSGKFAASQGTPPATPVAVKTIIMEKERRKSSTTSLYNEASMLNFILRLGGHTNILKIFGIYMQKKHPHLIVQLCYKFNLQEIINQHADIYTNKHLTHFASQITSAMAFLEEKHIVHRELKAANVLVSDDAECMLSGFHSALTAAKAKESEVAKDYTVTANPRWTAPEVYTGEVPYTSKSDVWSFGMLLIELFSQGSEPYQGIGNHTIKAIVTGGIMPKMPRSCPSNLQSLITQCLQTTASDRPTFVAVQRMIT